MPVHRRFQFNTNLSRLRYSLVIAVLAGALTVLGFAPFYFYFVPFITLAVLCALLHQAQSPRVAWHLGLCFGMGLYVTGLCWMVGTLHDYGEMPLWLACLASLGLCLYLASFTAIATWLVVSLRALWFLPFAWAVTEWLRGWLGGGFPWLTLGYSQVPSSLLAAYLPVTGVYGLSVLVLGCALCLFYLLRNRDRPGWTHMAVLLSLLVVAVGLQSVTWSVKRGEPVAVALLQGNINQETKWSIAQSKRIVLSYLEMIAHTDAHVMVLPETAFPIYLSQAMGKTREKLLNVANEKQADILIGLLDWQGDGLDRQKLNAVVNYGVSGLQVQHKAHLVPFGEFIPLKWLFSPLYERWFHVPHHDFSIGPKQALFSLGDRKVALSICYDELFGGDLARGANGADYLISVSNGAWFGHTFGLEQYLQFSQARAIENQRMLLRASNNGVTAIIDKQGHIEARAAKDVPLILQGMVQGYQGQTLYQRWQEAVFAGMVWMGVLGLVIRLRFVKKNSHNSKT